MREDAQREKRASTSISHQWRLRYHRPVSVGFAGTTLIILSFIALMSAPFLVVSQQMNGNLSYIPGMDPKVLGAAQAGASVVFCFLAFCILRGQNWARWGYLLFGGGLLGYVVFLFRSPWEALVAVFYLAFAGMFFNSRANDFFRLLREMKEE